MAHILIVDDEEVLRDLLSQILETEGHTCDQAGNGVEGCKQVRRREYDLIITDIRMPEMGGLDFLREIQPDVESRTPCMIITALSDEPDIAVKAVRLATDFLSKPFEVKTIKMAVGRALELREAWKFRNDYQQRLEEALHEKELELQTNHQNVLIAFAAMLEFKEDSLQDDRQKTRQHCERVRDYCTIVAREMGVTEKGSLEDLQLGAVLHDIGKFWVPDAILMKPGKLTAEEWVEMRKHPDHGARFVERIPMLKGALDVIQNHHERWDGGGYPQGLKEEEIPLHARIFFVVDTFDAITSKRCYKEALPADFALDEIRRNAGTQFDPAVVSAFERVYERLCERQGSFRGGEPKKNGRVPAPMPTAEALASTLRREVEAATRLAVRG